MTLPESKELRILKQTDNHLIKRVYQVIDDSYYRNIYCAWLGGASFLAYHLITKAESIKKLWDRGNEEKVIPLYEVCVHPMISIWFRYVEKHKGISEATKLQGKKNAISNTLDLIGSYSEEKVRDFLNLDTQYNYEEDFAEVRESTGEGGISTWYATLLIAKIKEAWMSKKLILWDEQVFPIKQESDFSLARQASPKDIVDFTSTGTYAGVNEILFLTALWIPDAGATMFDYFNTINK